jgi:hypothetical protein
MEAVKTQDGPRVLVVGMDCADNQFTRQVRNYGCKVEWVDGRTSAAGFPKFCDGVVIAAANCSHGTLWQLKDHYGRAKRPIFYGQIGFSSIKPAFEEFVLKWKKENPPSTAMAAAFKQAAPAPQIFPTKVRALEPAATGTGAANSQVRYAPEVKERLLRIVSECHEAKMSMQDTLDMLKAEGIKRGDGTWPTLTAIQQMRYKIKNGTLKLKKIKGSPTARSVDSKSAAVGAAPTESAKPRTTGHRSNEAELFDRVLKIDVSAERKVELLTRLNSGQLAAADALWLLSVIDEVRAGK